MEPKKQHLDFLDPIRGIAILAVFLFHSLGVGFQRDQLPWGQWLRNFADAKSFVPLFPLTMGNTGVAIFFVVSGFCIHLSFLRGRPGDWRGFFGRRFFRIYPPYLVALLFFCLVLPTTRLSFSSGEDWRQFFGHLLLLHNLDEVTYFGINPSLWTIAVEMQLYCIYPCLLALVGKFGWRSTLVGLGVLEFSLRLSSGIIFTVTGHYNVPSIPPWLTNGPLFFWFSWSIGAAVAEAFVKRLPLPFGTISPFVWLGLGVGANLVKPLSPLLFPFFALATASIITRLIQRDRNIVAWRPVSNHLALLGTVSYSFYLFHQPLLQCTREYPHRWGMMSHHPIIVFAICLSTYPLLLGLAWLCYRLFELPGVALGKQFLRQSKSVD